MNTEREREKEYLPTSQSVLGVSWAQPSTDVQMDSGLEVTPAVFFWWSLCWSGWMLKVELPLHPQLSNRGLKVWCHNWMTVSETPAAPLTLLRLPGNLPDQFWSGFGRDVQVFRSLLCHILMPVFSSMVSLRPWTFLSSSDWSFSAGRSLWCWKALCGPWFCWTVLGVQLWVSVKHLQTFVILTDAVWNLMHPGHFRLFICYFLVI